MLFEGTDALLRLNPCAGDDRVVRKILWVRREEPHPSIGVEHPMAPAPGIPEFWFERPAVGPIVDQLRPIILTRRSHYRETHAQDGLLPPRLEILYGHCRATLEIY